MKYITIAAALKLFSSCSVMKSVYRSLGNKFGSEKRLKSNVPNYYIDRVKRYVNLNKKYRVFNDGDRILELGTGWVHWEALSIRLFFDIEAFLFDVWDNRQLDVLKQYCIFLRDSIDSEIDIDPRRKEHALYLIEAINSTSSFEDLYKLVGFKYFIDPKGKLNIFGNESFNVIVSAGVLEHINKNFVAEYVHEFYRLLKPGGYSIHSVNMADHLSYYDSSASPKNYLKYSDTIWKVFFENEVQYFNRIQKAEWLKLFKEAGLILIEEESNYTDLSKVRVRGRYRAMEREDLECINVKLLHVKP